MSVDLSIRGSFIAGNFVPAENSETITLVDPSTEKELCLYNAAELCQVALAIDSALEGQKSWIKMPLRSRVEILGRFAQLVERDAHLLATFDSKSVGRPIRHTNSECAHLSEFVKFWCGLMRSGSISRGDRYSVIEHHLTFTSREPLGVVASIQPWNGPAASFIEGVSAILACGNSVIVKPSEISPLSALHMAQLFMESGAPKGLVNVLLGRGDIGSELVKADNVHGIGFTGSVNSGRAVGSLAGQYIKKVVLELGGKSPNIVFSDADMEQAVEGSLWGVFYNTGQLCCAGTRILVERSSFDRFVNAIKTKVSKINVGHALDPNTHMGPVASYKQFQTVSSYLNIAKSSRANFVCGNDESSTRIPEAGYFFTPTVLTDVEKESPLFQEEIFGPVVSILPFDTVEEAVELANGTKYGLAAKVWTKELQKMLHVSEHLEVGSVWGNSPWVGHPVLPFGGFKSSGVGSVNGIGSIEAFTQLKTVAIRYDDKWSSFPSWQA